MPKRISDILQGGLAWSKAHWNTYRIVTRRITWEELCDEDKTVLIICTPEELEEPEIVDILIDFYEEAEDYEKCAELKELIK